MTRAVLILLLSVGMLLPKATATLAFLLPGSFSTIVICTGTEVMTISLDRQGQPVDKAEIHGLDCLSETSQIRSASIAPAWQNLHLAYAFGFRLREAISFTPAPENRPSLGRAPPERASYWHRTSLA